VPRARGLARLPQVAHVEGRGALQQLVQAPALLAALGGLRILLDGLELDAVALGQRLQRLLEPQALGQLDELEQVAALARSRSSRRASRRVDAERRGALVVEGAEALHAVDARPAQLHARADQVGHVDRVADPVAGLLGVPHSAKASGTDSDSNARMQ
jgi:hypothetical protein